MAKRGDLSARIPEPHPGGELGGLMTLLNSTAESLEQQRAAIARARTEKGRESAVWKHLESRRGWWARQFAVSAATLQSASDPDLWLSFATVAQALDRLAHDEAPVAYPPPSNPFCRHAS